MTRHFNVHYTCQYCGKQSSAETAFGRWMRAQSQLDSRDCIVRTDTDHTILRYRTRKDGRDYKLVFNLEVKEWGSYPDPSQKEILAINHAFTIRKGKNMHGHPTQTAQWIRLPNGNRARVRHYGYHLLQFEQTGPEDSAWIRWDKKEITEDQLLKLLRFDLNPDDPRRPMDEFLRDRHAQKELPFLLFDLKRRP